MPFSFQIPVPILIPHNADLVQHPKERTLSSNFEQCYEIVLVNFSSFLLSDPYICCYSLFSFRGHHLPKLISLSRLVPFRSIPENPFRKPISLMLDCNHLCCMSHCCLHPLNINAIKARSSLNCSKC